MSSEYVPAALRRQVAQEARHRCGYCLTPERIVGRPMVIDHIVPIARGGATVSENLWLACRRCNEFKGSQTHAVDPVTEVEVPLFSPRRQSWPVHFAWSEDGTKIVGLTATGQATVAALRLNNEAIVGARWL